MVGPTRVLPCSIKNLLFGGHVGGQSVKRPTLAQVMISQLVVSSPVSCSVLTSQILEAASDSVSPSLSAPPTLFLSLSQK